MLKNCYSNKINVIYHFSKSQTKWKFFFINYHNPNHTAQYTLPKPKPTHFIAAVFTSPPPPPSKTLSLLSLVSSKSSRNIINLFTSRQIHKLVSDLDLKSPKNRSINIHSHNNLLILTNLSRQSLGNSLSLGGR